MEINRENLLAFIKSGIKRNALSMTGLEKEANVPRDTVRDFMRGKTQVLRADKLQKIMRVLEPQRKVRIAGFIGADAEVFFSDPAVSAKEEVECPPGYEVSDVVAVKIKGDGMLPVFHDGWVIYYTRRSDLATPAISGGYQVPYGKAARGKQFAEFVGKPCIVSLGDGHVMLGTLKRSSGKNGYDLVNHNAADLHNIRPEWAARIIFIKTE